MSIKLITASCPIPLVWISITYRVNSEKDEGGENDSRNKHILGGKLLYLDVCRGLIIGLEEKLFSFLAFGQKQLFYSSQKL